MQFSVIVNRFIVKKELNSIFTNDFKKNKKIRKILKVTDYAALRQDYCKPVFRNSDHVRLKSACSATETARILKFHMEQG